MDGYNILDLVCPLSNIALFLLLIGLGLHSTRHGRVVGELGKKKGFHQGKIAAFEELIDGGYGDTVRAAAKREAAEETKH